MSKLLKHEYGYWVEGYHEPYDEAVTFSSTWTTKALTYVAEDAAEHWFDFSDPGEWPKVFHIFNTDNYLLGTFDVDMEAQPVFMARKRERDGN